MKSPVYMPSYLLQTHYSIDFLVCELTEPESRQKRGRNLKPGHISISLNQIFYCNKSMCTEYCWQDNSEEKKFPLHFFYVNMITCPKVLFLILKSRPFSAFYFFLCWWVPFYSIFHSGFIFIHRTIKLQKLFFVFNNNFMILKQSLFSREDAKFSGRGTEIVVGLLDS